MEELNLSMLDFTHPFWSWFVGVGTILSIAFCFWLVWWMTRGNPMEKTASSKDGDKTTGHQWDETLQEYNNPLPGWWLQMFYLTLFFSIVYLALYPGLGSYAGIWQWSSRNQYDKEMQYAASQYDPIFEAFKKQEIPELAKNADAMTVGKRLYLNYCTVCHGSDAGGNKGFPNLTDNDWLWGGDPTNIKTTIMQGRAGIMPNHQTNGLTVEDVDNVVQYVLTLSGREGTDAAKAEQGKAKFMTICMACHGTDGKGNPMLGAPNLTDNVWLYGAHPDTIKQTIMNGRNGVMPAHGEFLGEAKVHLLSAYIYSLSNK